MKMNKVSVIPVILAVAFSPLQAKVLDRTVATVNGEAIMLSDFEKNATPILEQFKHSAPPAEQTPEHVEDIKKRVIDQMIDDRLLVQEAKKKNIHVTQMEVDDGVKKVHSRFNTEDEFKKELEQESLTFDEFRTHIQEQLMTIKLIDQEVKAKVPPPSDSDVKDLYNTLEAIMNDKPIPGSHTSSELDELKALARAVQHRFGERVRARHILIHVAQNASKADRDAALEKIKDVQRRLKKGEDFGDLAKKYSDDPGSKDKGGELPPFSRGDMVPAFEKAAFALNVGDTSDIVQTNFGYHIIQVLEKKAATKPSFDEVKDDLRDYLFQQRGAKRFEDYVKDLRAKSDIKINKID